MSKIAEFLFILLLAVGVFGGFVSKSDTTSSTFTDTENFYTNEDYAPFEELEQGYGYYASDSNYSVHTEYDYSQYNESGGYAFYAQDYKNYPLDEEMYNYEDSYGYAQYDKFGGYEFYAQDYKNYPLDEEMYDYEEYLDNR